MKILQRYILRQTLVTLVMTVAVFTFVLLLAGMLRQLSEMVINRHMGLGLVAQYLLLLTPYLLSFSLPMSILASALLVFARLSADNEINAMRASGVSLQQVAAPVILLALLAAGLCFYINASLAPSCRLQFKTMSVRLGVEQPMALLEEGAMMRDFPGYRVYVGRIRAKQHLIEDVIIQVLDDKGNPISRLEARRGIVSANPQTNTLLLDLYDVRGDLRDPSDPTNARKFRPGTTAQRYPIALDLGKALRQISTTKRAGDCTFSELLAEMASQRAQGIYPSTPLMEAHQRVAAAAACVAFALIGIPLGLKTNRRETMIGIGISILLATGFYFLTVLANVFKAQPQYYPEALLWLPNLAFEIIGLWLLWRVARA